MELRLLRYFVAVAEERNIGRAARRLLMTQPPLSRAVRQLESELGLDLLVRTGRGVELTAAGAILLDEARAIVARADELPARVAGAVGAPVMRIGLLVDSADKRLSIGLVDAFRTRHPGVLVSLQEVDLTQPAAGLDAGRVDVALTRTPFDDEGIATLRLQTHHVGAVLHASDPLAARASLRTEDLAGRTWARIPETQDREYLRFWTAAETADAHGPAIRTVQEGLHEALWNRAVVIAPLGQELPEGLVCVALADRPPSSVVLAWRRSDRSPLVRSFAEIARAAGVEEDRLGA